MFSGKTTKLQSLIKHCKVPYAVFVHPLQNKFETHDCNKQPYIATDDFNLMCNFGKGKLIWFIDEIQFFPMEVVRKLLNRPETLYFTGLDTDFNGRPFEITQFLINTIDSTRLKAICECGKPAVYSQLIGEKPETNILIGDCYVPRCAFCFCK